MGSKSPEQMQILRGANVLVTGGAGSVGKAIVTRLMDTNIQVIRIFDNSEAGLASMKANRGNDQLRYLAGDIRDKSRLERAMEDIDIVIHAAAMKHVDISEYNPFEAVKTNVMGLQNVVDIAIDMDVDRVVFTSSDKAVNPANTMGTTKLLGEKLVTAGNKYRGGADLRLSSVRFGNVVGSSGSVIPLFEEQISEGGPVTLTDRRMTRFFLTHGEMADLLVSAVCLTEGGEVFVRKMTGIRIEDLANAMVRELAPEYGYDTSNIDINIVGRRVGETVHEKIMTEREAQRAIENDTLYAIPPDTESDKYLDYEGIEGFEPATDPVKSSENATLLDQDEIVPFVNELGTLEVDL
jgi:FlaA1/EpsC-like NDP-sugar epimerase